MKQSVYEGDIKITKENQAEWQEKLKSIKEITGDLSIHSNVTLQAPKLVRVGGYLSIHSVGGSLSIERII